MVILSCDNYIQNTLSESLKVGDILFLRGVNIHGRSTYQLATDQ